VNPFTALHLPASPSLTDEQVRTAWRHAAAATHPDRPDGGNPAAYAAASAAYEQLRTPWGRSEALADLAAGSPHGPPTPAPDPLPWHALLTAAAVLPARIRRGRPLRLAVRAAVAAAAACAAVLLVPGTPSAPAAAFGCALWLVLTARADLAPPPGR
jgi:curved DNA-binding protein CbpA